MEGTPEESCCCKPRLVAAEEDFSPTRVTIDVSKTVIVLKNEENGLHEWHLTDSSEFSAPES